jgi:hypothetical protein
LLHERTSEPQTLDSNYRATGTSKLTVAATAVVLGENYPEETGYGKFFRNSEENN